MNIEKKLERIIDIGDWQGCFRLGVYNCWYDSDDPLEDSHLRSALNKSLALWMEFNEIVAEIDDRTQEIWAIGNGTLRNNWK